MAKKKSRSPKKKVEYVLVPIKYTIRDIEEAFSEIKPALDKLREYDLKQEKEY